MVLQFMARCMLAATLVAASGLAWAGGDHGEGEKAGKKSASKVVTTPRQREAAHRKLDAIRAEFSTGRYEIARTKLLAIAKSPHVSQVDVQALAGLIELSIGLRAHAAKRFAYVLRVRPTKLALWVFLGQARYATKQFAKALAALRRGEKTGKTLPAYWLLRARCQLSLKRPAAAISVLNRAYRLLPKAHQLLREQAVVLAEMQLFSAAKRAGLRYLAHAPKDPYGYLLVGEALRRAGAYPAAITIFERALLRFPTRTDLIARLAYSYAHQRQHATAARLFARATRLGAAMHYEAAEQYRLAGRFRRALAENGKVSGKARQLKQRMAIVVAAERWSLAAALVPALRRAGIQSDTMRYLGALALLRAGQPAEAKAVAQRIAAGPYASSAKRLIAACDRCSLDSRYCR
jgi:tetratricopeptide (TPR) repeat protein